MATPTEIEKAVEQMENASKLVKELAASVEKGVTPKSELQDAMRKLQATTFISHSDLYISLY